MEADFLSGFYGKLINKLSLARALDTELPPGVTAQLRTDGITKYIFLMNFNNHEAKVELDANYEDLLGGEKTQGTLNLEPFGVRVLQRV